MTVKSAPRPGRGHGDGGQRRPDLSVIIVSHQTCALTLRAIDAALSQSGPSLEVIVVDNASSDGTAAAITRRFPQVRLFAQDSNLGFARANNLAAKQARGHFLLLLNPDTVAQPGAFAEITDFARQRPEAMIWGGRVLRPDGTNSPRSGARRPTLWSVIAQAAGLSALWPASPLVNPEAMPGWNRDEIREVDIVIGCFLLIRHDDWGRLGGFDPAYFMFGEDLDLCLRAAHLDARPAITPSATILHEEGASQQYAPREVQILAARIRYLRQHLPRFQRAPAVWAVRLGVILRLACYSLAAPFPAHRSRLARMPYVWAKRELWWSGYPDLTEPASS
ncbi:glycosyltransferase family 2 protein [Antarctobacter jejuensis]|uniref:glycosyltransferase family 2 protein n=1 Tax=Antarctobacter jejuensis TaxID=1439938 RepID=UPI003FD57C09